MKVGVIGFGKMGSALAIGAARQGVLKPASVTVFDSDPAAARRIRRFGFRRAATPAEAVFGSEILLICVKPQQIADALDAVRRGFARRRPCVVSIAAGVPLKRLRKALGDCPVVRVMPNTPALLGAGVSAMSPSANVSPAQRKRVRTLLGAVGTVIEVPERLMDAVTAVSGSGPAYVFYLAEAIIDAGRRQGLSPSVARTLAHETVRGAGLMLAERPEPADELRRQVTSPGGTTAAAIATFDRRGLKGIVREAIGRAAKRSKELAKS